MTRCNEWIELVYADAKKRIPGESWSVRCRRTDTLPHLHEAVVRWASSDDEVGREIESARRAIRDST